MTNNASKKTPIPLEAPKKLSPTVDTRPIAFALVAAAIIIIIALFNTNRYSLYLPSNGRAYYKLDRHTGETWLCRSQKSGEQRFPVSEGDPINDSKFPKLQDRYDSRVVTKFAWHCSKDYHGKPMGQSVSYE